MTLHPNTFDYLKPTPEQALSMNKVRAAAKEFASVLARELPDGPDKTWVIRHHRTTAMWANVAITRTAEGAPREDKVIQKHPADIEAEMLYGKNK